MIDPERGLLYRQIADELRAEIERGTWPPGTRLPSAVDLGHRYDVNPHTVRDALKVLARQGVVSLRRGRAARVLAAEEITVVQVPAGHRLGARPPTDEERQDLGISESVWVLVLYEVVPGAQGQEPTLVARDVWPADRTQVAT